MPAFAAWRKRKLTHHRRSASLVLFMRLVIETVIGDYPAFSPFDVRRERWLQRTPPNIGAR